MASFENSPSFFAIVLDNTLRTNKLLIPGETARRCGSSLRGDVVLKVPGSEWKMSLSTTVVGNVRKVYIDDGWLAFSRHFSIARGHLLCLRYVADSRFDVVIFDLTTKEIDHYPVKRPVESETGNRYNNPVKIEDRDDDYSPSPCARPSARSLPEKRKRGGKQAVSGCEPSLGSVSPFSRSKGKETRRAPVSRAHKGKLKEKQAMRSNAGHSVEATERARERAKSFAESTQPSFSHVLRACHFRAPGYISIPWLFAESYLRLSKRIVLIAPGKAGKSVNFHWKGENHRPGFRAGWVAFAKDNGLRAGDACVFALAKSDETALLEVSFFYKNGDSNTHSATDSATRPKASAVDEQPGNPSFAVFMHSSYFDTCGGHLRLPARFAKEYLKTSPREIRLRDSSGRSWFIEYKATNGESGNACVRRYLLSNGWSNFRKKIGLKEGDICAFELTNQNDVSFDVRIVKPTHRDYEKMHKALGPKRTKPMPFRGEKKIPKLN